MKKKRIKFFFLGQFRLDIASHTSGRQAKIFVGLIVMYYMNLCKEKM